MSLSGAAASMNETERGKIMALIMSWPSFVYVPRKVDDAKRRREAFHGHPFHNTSPRYRSSQSMKS